MWNTQQVFEVKVIKEEKKVEEVLPNYSNINGIDSSKIPLPYRYNHYAL